MSAEESTIRADMEAAMDTVEEANPAPEVVDEVETAAAEETTQEAEEVVSGEGEPSGEELEVAADSGKADVPAGEPAEKPPVDWSPTLIDKWSSLPEEVRGAISGRERQVHQLMEQTATQRHLAEQFIRTCEPYQALMQAEGVQHPLQAVDGLLKTTAVLQMGTPGQKAAKLAELFTHYGIDLNLLDQALAGQMPAEDAAPAQPQDPRIDWMMGQMQNAQQNQTNQVNYEAAQSVGEFAATQPEFYEAVRMVMADELDLAASQGRKLSIEDSYASSCWKNAEIRGILLQRQNDEALTGGGLMGKRNAASSITGGKAGSSTQAEVDNMSMREVIEAQFEGEQRI